MDDSTLPWFLTCAAPLDIYKRGNFCAVDLETDSTQNGSPLLESNDIVLACWSVYKNNKLVKKRHLFDGIYGMAELLDDIADSEFMLAQNAKFESGYMKRCGVELRDLLVYDPMLAQWVLDGNQKGKGFERSLRGLARRYGGRPKLDLVGKLLDAGVPTREINTRWLLEYCERDVDAMVDVFFEQLKVVEQRNVAHLVHTRNLTCTALADIEFNGFQLDKDKVYAEHARVKQRLQELDGELADITGGINLGSPKQLATLLYDKLKFKEPTDHRGKKVKTASGERSTKAQLVYALKPETEEQEVFMKLYKEYNKQASLLEKSLEYFKLVCDNMDGKFHAVIKQNSTGTHRLASSGIKAKFEVGRKESKKGVVSIKYKDFSVQMQNTPREYKGLFWAEDPDYLCASYDSSQVEFRVAVDMAKDEVGYNEVINGVDIHQFTAQVLYENGDPEMLSIDDPKERRQQSKKNSFRPLYGGSSGGEALQAYCEFFKDKYSGISGMQRDWALTCVDKKQYTTPMGMTFYFPAEIQRSGYISFTTQIYNYPVQSSATAEIIPLALVYMWHRSKDLRAELFVTIHDSIDARVHKDDVAELDEIAIQSLTLDVYKHLSKVYNYNLTTPLGLGLKHNRWWSEGKEIKYDVLLDGTRVER